MIRSMTGFGEAEEVTAAGVVRVEIKTVNHRFFNTNIRTPTGFDRLEGDIQSWLRPFLSRGHVTYMLSINRETTEANDTLPELDLERAKRYGELLETLRSELGVEAPVDLSHISRFGEIFRAPEPGNLSAQVEGKVIRRVTEAAAAEVVELREAEGARLQRDLEEHLQAIEEALVSSRGTGSGAPGRGAGPVTGRGGRTHRGSLRRRGSPGEGDRVPCREVGSE